MLDQTKPVYQRLRDVIANAILDGTFRDGDVLFTATRAVPGESDPQPALWRLPAAGGEAQLLISRPGGVSSVSAAKAAPTFGLNAAQPVSQLPT